MPAFLKNILLADANYPRTQRLGRLLNRLEYNVFISNTPADLLRMAQRLLPNLIILDLRMPFHEGSDCLAMLRRDRPLDIVKVIVAGELSDEALLTDCLSKGAQAVIRRPINPTELYIIIHKLIEPNPRRSIRLRVIFKVKVIHGSSVKAYFATVISDQGLFIRTTEPLDTNETVKVVLDLPSTRPIEFSGMVIYRTRFDKETFQEPGMGIKFLDIDKDLQRNLRRFIESCLTGEHYDTLGI
ncbi:MAG: response regulator [Deltaproteobacteria bacterium]|nr:response regulator [Deltaproteobacteria bacterium]